jgi:hypothetical protein
MSVHVPILDAAFLELPMWRLPDHPFEGRHVRAAPDTSTEMLVRRDGSIDLRVLAGRLGAYLAISSIAVGLGALLALMTS